MSGDDERLTRRHNLYLLGLAVAFLSILPFLGSRIFQTGTFLLDAFLEKCLAKCSSLMSLGISAVDGLEVFAVLASAGLLLVALVRSISEARRARAFSCSLREVETPPRLHRLLEELALSPQLVVVFSSRLSFACTAGLLHPRVFVSTGLIESLSDEELKAVLRHEQSHLDRRDPIRSIVMLFLSKFFFFLPLVSRLLDSLRRDSELIADRHALALASSPADLASALIKTKSRNLVVAQGLARFWGDDLLGERLSRILNADVRARKVVHARRFSPVRLAAGALLALSVSLLVIPAGAGFLRKSPWTCPHTDHASCCPPAAPGSQCSHCRY